MKDIEKDLQEALKEDEKKLNETFSRKIEEIEGIYKKIKELENDKAELYQIHRKIKSIVSPYSNSTDFELKNIMEKIKPVDKEIDDRKKELNNLVEQAEEDIERLLKKVSNEDLKNEILKYQEKLRYFKNIV